MKTQRDAAIVASRKYELPPAEHFQCIEPEPLMRPHGWQAELSQTLEQARPRRGRGLTKATKI